MMCLNRTDKLRKAIRREKKPTTLLEMNKTERKNEMLKKKKRTQKKNHRIVYRRVNNASQFVIA